MLFSRLVTRTHAQCESLRPRAESPFRRASQFSEIQRKGDSASRERPRTIARLVKYKCKSFIELGPGFVACRYIPCSMKFLQVLIFEDFANCPRFTPITLLVVAPVTLRQYCITFEDLIEFREMSVGRAYRNMKI